MNSPDDEIILACMRVVWQSLKGYWLCSCILSGISFGDVEHSEFSIGILILYVRVCEKKVCATIWIKQTSIENQGGMNHVKILKFTIKPRWLTFRYLFYIYYRLNNFNKNINTCLIYLILDCNARTLRGEHSASDITSFT